MSNKRATNHPLPESLRLMGDTLHIMAAQVDDMISELESLRHEVTSLRIRLRKYLTNEVERGDITGNK